MTQIKEAVKLEDLGIADLCLIVASTGARVLKLPGANSGEKADALAQRLRGALDASEVSVQHGSAAPLWSRKRSTGRDFWLGSYRRECNS